MYVYRLEDKDGNGPFHKAQQIATYLTMHNDPTEPHMLASIRHTRRQFDSYLKEYVYGWRTQKQAQLFVRKNRRQRVYDLGWRINRYRVKSHTALYFHDGQVLFRKDRAVLVSEIDFLGIRK